MHSGWWLQAYVGIEVLVIANCTLHLGSAQIMITLSWVHDDRENLVAVKGGRNWWLLSHLAYHTYHTFVGYPQA